MTQQFITKEVTHAGVTMISCQDKTGEIFVSVKSICDGLGIDYNGQYQRIKRDDTLSKGMCKIHIPTNGGLQDINMMIISFLPFFLTGVKSSMVKPEIKDKILEFKLKAKDVLSQAFLPQLAQPQPTFEYHMIECVKSINDNVNKIESDLNQFKQEVKTELKTLKQLKQTKQLPAPTPQVTQLQKPQADYYTTLYNSLRYSTKEQFYKLVNNCFEKIANARNESISDTEQYIYDFLYSNRKNWNSMAKGLSLQMEQNSLIYSGWKYTCVPYSAILKKRYATAVVDVMKHYEV